MGLFVQMTQIIKYHTEHSDLDSKQLHLLSIRNPTNVLSVALAKVVKVNTAFHPRKNKLDPNLKYHSIIIRLERLELSSNLDNLTDSKLLCCHRIIRCNFGRHHLCHTGAIFPWNSDTFNTECPKPFEFCDI
jgi:hypothetical protein